MNDNVRCFFCLPLTPELTNGIGSWIDENRKKRTLPAARWVTRQNLHITLVFCGEIAPSSVKALSADAQREISTLSLGELKLSVERLGTFGRPPRVLYARTGGQTKELSALYSVIAELCRGHGIEVPDRKFSPHLTLARLPGTDALDPEALNWSFAGTPWAAQRVIFMRSRLSPQGAKYSPITEIKL